MKVLATLFISFFLFIASQAFSQNLEVYVSDAGNFSSPPWKILKFDENGENPEVFINQNLAWPQDIVFLEDQDVVLISNLNSGRITKYNSTNGSYIDDFATGIGGPTRMKIGTDSLLYVLQWQGNGKVRRYQLDGAFVDEFTSVGVAQSIGLDWDDDGNLYISSYNGRFVRKFDTHGNDLGRFITSNLQGPTNIWFDESGDLLVSDYNSTSVKRFDSTGTFLGNFLTGLSNAEGVDFLPNGNILIGNGGTGSVKMFDSGGNFIEDFISAGAGNLIRPNAVIIRENNVSSVSDEEDNGVLDLSFTLKQNYPNPFNPTTIIKYQLQKAGNIKISVYDILGNEIERLEEGYKNPGLHQIDFDGSKLPAGVYIYRISDSQQKSLTKKMVLIK